MRRAVGLLGGAAVLAGGAATVAGDRIVPVPVPYPLVVALAGVALVVGAVALLDRRLSDPDRTTPPDTERGYRVPVPGGDLDASLATSSSPFRRRLADRVRASLVARRGCSPPEARDRVRRGIWTDDPVAAAYLGSGDRIPLAVRLRWWLRGADAREESARRAVAALATLREEGRRD